MYNSAFFKKFVDFFNDIRARLTALESYKTYPYTVTTGSDGTVTLDYTSLGLVKPPTIAFTVEVATKTTIVPSIALIGSPTKTSATFLCQKVNTVLGLGIAPSYVGVSGLKLDILVKPTA